MNSPFNSNNEHSRKGLKNNSCLEKGEQLFYYLSTYFAIRRKLWARRGIHVVVICASWTCFAMARACWPGKTNEFFFSPMKGGMSLCSSPKTFSHITSFHGRSKIRLRVHKVKSFKIGSFLLFYGERRIHRVQWTLMSLDSNVWPRGKEVLEYKYCRDIFDIFNSLLVTLLQDKLAKVCWSLNKT